MNTNRRLILAVCLIFSAAAMLPARTWTEASTGRTLEGDFVKATDTAVTLRLRNGSSIELPLARLSEADQAFIKEQTAAKPAAGKPGDKPAGKDDAKNHILGTWTGYMADSDGSRHGDIRLEITAEKITATNPQGNRPMGAGTYKLSGNRIDAQGTEGQFAGKKYEGICEIEGRTLKWCSANDNPRSQRPSKLQTNVQAGQFLMVLEKD